MVRCNRFVQLTPGRAMIAVDALCEHLNRYLAELCRVKTVEALVDESALLALIHACRKYVKLWYTG